MNITRIAILGVAALAAGGAALLVRGILGGGTPEVLAEVPEPQFEIINVLVAAESIEPGRTLTVDSVRWEEWPDTNVSDELVTRDAHPEIKDYIEGAVSRAPLIVGEPITENKIVHADSGSFMSATLVDGMRAVAIPISAESGAGGFILPNDRVDVILTREIEGEDTTVFEARTILEDVRVLAIDQVVRQEEEEEYVDYVVANTATLELKPEQSVLLARAQATGELSLALRGLGDVTVSSGPSLEQDVNVTVLRYGVARSGERNIIVGSGIQ